ncbi:unnamed protein product, partial [Ilex paraguariensis]
VYEGKRKETSVVSTFGAVLDMVTDRISTACLLVILSQVYRPGLVFLSLLALDIASHWLQMYSTFLVGKASHKDVKDSTSWLFKAYYGNRIFMGYCCVACEVLYITLFLLAKNQAENMTDVLVNAAKQSLVHFTLVALLLFGWAIKQTINVIQVTSKGLFTPFYIMNFFIHQVSRTIKSSTCCTEHPIALNLNILSSLLLITLLLLICNSHVYAARAYFS